VNGRIKIALLLGALAGPAFSGCALTQRSEAIPWQYFTPEGARAPELTSAPINGAATPGAPAARRPLCLGRVNAGTSLGTRIAYREGEHQMGYYDDRRWTEEPSRYVRRALERTLYQESGLQCTRDVTVPTLDVEVLGFEEQKLATSHAARVELRAVLRTRERVLFDENVQVVDPVVGGSFDDVVAALGRALEKASRDLTRRTTTALATDNGSKPAE
jgi:ABC-type uncharacterized transport system auxiliary subunit